MQFLAENVATFGHRLLELLLSVHITANELQSYDYVRIKQRKTMFSFAFEGVAHKKDTKRDLVPVK